jgi:fucose 4-O-acetylase-like acetyltransferase
MSSTKPLEAGTVSGRDPFLDVIRAFAMIAVVANHMLYPLLYRSSQGSFAFSWLQNRGQPWVTWPFVWELQAFFLPAAALSFGAAMRGPWQSFVGRRAWRLVVPAVPVLLAIVALELITRSAGMGSCGDPAAGLTCSTLMAIGPLWFLVAILVLSAFTPLMVRFWRGPWRILMPLAVVLLTVLSDFLWVSTGSALPGNEIAVWALVWFAGFAYAEGSLDDVAQRTWWWIVALGSLVMVGLVVAGPYQAHLGAHPRSMMTVMECVVGVSLLMALRRRIQANRDHPFVDLCVRGVGGRTMGVFLWHGFAFVAVVSVAALMGVELASDLGVPYLVQRVIMIPIALVLLAALLRVTAWTDEVPYPPDRRRVDLRSKG